jgi:short subunit dehydrogenase-like uncharacterized protein
VVWGATGFTGHLVAEYLTRKYGVGRGLVWALGGRSRGKLEEVRRRLEALDPAARDLPLVTGDSSDRASLDAMARDARVVLTTVGPYALYGAELVAACVDAGTDYCDLAGETPFIRQSIERHHARAQASGTKIVHCCGYDSIPSDLGTFFAQETMRARHGVPCAEVKCFAGEARGGMSGGTVASMLNMMDTATHDRRVRRILADPYSLDPGRDQRGPDGPDPMGVRYDADIGRWTGPFVMAAINSRVVRRTNALLGYAWGRDFRYTEAMSFKPGPAGLVTAAGVSAGLAASFGILAVGPLRRWAARSFLPKPGDGPSEKVRETGFFVHRLIGIAGTSAGPSRAKVLVTVKGKGDPGYGATSRMLAESAVCMAKDRDALPPAWGVLTPATAMGMALLERLRKVDFSFEAAAS